MTSHEPTTDKTGAATSVRDSASAQRYEITVDGTADGVVAGFAEYRDRVDGADTERVFFHTEVADEFGGRGLATTLVREALDDARARGLVIVGVCPLVAAFLEKHPEYADAARPVSRDVLGWLRRQQS
ncbi:MULTISPECIES: GNAT family N-acetyltransferase [Gordonia]|uniref:GNAT family N-acetyltransferase n=1 Tax=Gordonia amicalis TaxID=89053 RepID=A0AAE4R3T8_9ACTN|nr:MULTISPECIES: GNAT family N-acetyltransferase [Gordonia]ATD71972.1 GNAT family N-acetyltransferase [Gordonia sp. 1D]MCZ4650688.1 GNAT family N-acetyltransferase [Gordonia amicalis]MDV6306563.1 GNAT family N-acetyltransferase [Gordonia amicalis]MDV6311292.1 GNAT family N-acetyltransferase [Gordonia amicalis]